MKIAESISERKIDVTKLVMAIEDAAVLDEIYAILLNAADNEANWYENLDAEDKASIERGRADIAAGRVHTTEEVMREARTWRK